MTISQELKIDVFQHRVKAQTQTSIFDFLANDAAPHCGVDVASLADLLEERQIERLFSVVEGSAVYDIQSHLFKRQAIVVSTFDKPIDFCVLDHAGVDVMISVFSPLSYGPKHLQKLAQVSRILKNDDFCTALRDARDVDSMRVLFMPRQKWIEAA